MSRDSKGRFVKGISGNPKGRPLKPKREFTTHQLRADILHAMENKFVVSVGGKRKKQPIMQLIREQFLRKAVLGNERCMLKAMELQTELLAQCEQARDEFVEACNILRRKQDIDPDELTDDELEVLRSMDQLLDPKKPI